MPPCDFCNTVLTMFPPLTQWTQKRRRKLSLQFSDRNVRNLNHTLKSDRIHIIFVSVFPLTVLFMPCFHENNINKRHIAHYKIYSDLDTFGSDCNFVQNIYIWGKTSTAICYCINITLLLLSLCTRDNHGTVLELYIKESFRIKAWRYSRHC
mgnify:FL=1